MSTELTLMNARIVLQDEVAEGSVALRDGLIHDLSAGPHAGNHAIDCGGDYLIPGMIDLHTDNYERVVRPRNSVNWPVRAALVAHDVQMVASGITTILDSLYVGHIGFGSRNFETLKNTIAELAACGRDNVLRGDHFLHLRAETSMEQMFPQLESVFPDPHVLLVSMMDHTPGQRQWRDLEKYVAMEKRDFHLTQEEIDKFLSNARERHETLCGPNRERLIGLVAKHPVPLASHDDTTVEHVEEAHGEGVSISEFPTTLEAAKAARAKGMWIIAGSPNLVLGGSHSGNVAAEELVREGLLDGLASDYVPASMLHGAFLLHQKMGMTLPEAIHRVTEAPARMVGLNDRGSIDVGKRGDLVRVRCVGELALVMSVWKDGVRV